MRGARYPLAVDIDGDLGVVSFAALALHPHIDSGWWCVAQMFERSGAGWAGSSEDDNTTSPTPFTRPLVAENGPGWLDWGSNCGLMGWGDGDFRLMCFGIAPVGTARMTITDGTGRERDLRITPWNGAFVAVVRGTSHVLTGYDASDRVLGSSVCDYGPDAPADAEDPERPEPPPGWHRVDPASLDEGSPSLGGKDFEVWARDEPEPDG